MIDLSDIRPDPSWQEVVDHLREGPSWRTLLVVGANDTGKTSLCRYLGASLARDSRVAIIDCDPGQSSIALPATVGMAWEPERTTLPGTWEFVGTTTPKGNQQGTLAAIGHVRDRALALGAEKLLFDSCGMIEGLFPSRLARLIAPSCVVAIETGYSFQDPLATVKLSSSTRIYRVKKSAAVAFRGSPERRAYRAKRFRAYFNGATSQHLVLAGITLTIMGEKSYGENEILGDPLVALYGRTGLLALALLEKWEFGSSGFRGMRFYGPAVDSNQVKEVRVGSLRLGRDGEEPVSSWAL